jgi:hypothetical protein
VPENEGPTLLLSIHVNNAGLAFITVTNPGPSANCAFTLIGFDSTTASGRVMYATALEAFTTGARVVVSYERSGAGCSVTQLSLTK